MPRIQADSEHIEYFYYLLAQHGGNLIEVEDAEGEISLVIAKDMRRARTELLLSGPRRHRIDTSSDEDELPGSNLVEILNSHLCNKGVGSTASAKGTERIRVDEDDERREDGEEGDDKEDGEDEEGGEDGEEEEEGEETLTGGEEGEEGGDTGGSEDVPDPDALTNAGRTGVQDAQVRHGVGRSKNKEFLKKRARVEAAEAGRQEEARKRRKMQRRHDWMAEQEATRVSPLVRRATDWLAAQVRQTGNRRLQGMESRGQDLLVSRALSVAGPDAVGDWWDIVRLWHARGSLVLPLDEGQRAAFALDLPQSAMHGSDGNGEGDTSSGGGSQGDGNGGGSDDDVMAGASYGAMVPFAGASSGHDSHDGPDGHDRALIPPRQAFLQAYEAASGHQLASKIGPIVRRFALAELQERYDEATRELVKADRLDHGPNGRRARSRAKRSLFNACYPKHEGVADLGARGDNDEARTDWKGFELVLRSATRMRALRVRLGDGALCLIPDATLSLDTLTKRFTNAQFELWLELIARFNKRYYKLRTGIMGLLRRGLAGLPPCDGGNEGAHLPIARVTRREAVECGLDRLANLVRPQPRLQQQAQLPIPDPTAPDMDYALLGEIMSESYDFTSRLSPGPLDNLFSSSDVQDDFSGASSQWNF